MMPQSRAFESQADFARRHGWGPGTRLVGDEGYGPTVIEIVALGRTKVLATALSHDGLSVIARESSWTLSCREWTVLVEGRDPLTPLDSIKVALRDHGNDHVAGLVYEQLRADGHLHGWEPQLVDDAPRSPLLVLVAAMVDRAPVRVLADLKNGIGEVTREAGWETTIREIRRPALHEAAYGHLEPVIVIDGGKGLSICLRAEDVEVVS